MGGGGGGVWWWGKREIIFPLLHCHHQNDSSIKIGSDESHFNVSLIVRDSHEPVSTDHNSHYVYKANGNVCRCTAYIFTSACTS